MDFIPFPHIGHLHHLVTTQATGDFKETLPKTLRYVGTVKLHGTNMGVSQACAGGPLTVQSRNRLLSVESDNCGSAAFVAQRAEAFHRIFAAIRDTSRAQNDDPVMIYGEMAGRKVQLGVGISGRPPFFAAFCVTVGGQRVDLRELAHAVQDKASDIFNVVQLGGIYDLQVDRDDPMACAERVKNVTEDVGEDCPAARYLGCPGPGEGLVWTCLDADAPDLWFKSKAEAHCVAVSQPRPVTSPADAERFADDFAASYAPEARMIQGIDYLREQGLPDAWKSMNDFLKFVVADVMREEGSHLAPEIAKACRKAVTQRTLAWFRARHAN